MVKERFFFKHSLFTYTESAFLANRPVYLLGFLNY